MGHYSCSNGTGYRFTLSATDAKAALSRAVTQFTMHGQYVEPVMASSVTDPCDYYSTHQLKESYRQTDFDEAVLLEALNQFDNQVS